MKYCNNPSEDAICIQFVDFLKIAPRKKPFIFFHISNEISNNKHPAFGQKLLRMGKLPGAPDYIFLWESDVGCIEFKSALGRLTSNQKNFQESCRTLNIKYEIARSFDDGESILKKWELI